MTLTETGSDLVRKIKERKRRQRKKRTAGGQTDSRTDRNALGNGTMDENRINERTKALYIFPPSLVVLTLKSSSGISPHCFFSDDQENRCLGKKCTIDGVRGKLGGVCPC